ncbi:8459_t:CDS:2 [Paraglomus occultum]|uniref:8459_t:CDS:1 n=1 Tax=Paraglomus occultum TaxID=144539 RepID=A0A9N9CB96_9GLOM|nr:8459_t:CDS:2 [Paraglomus occultum]
MSAIATRIVGKYNLNPGMSVSELSKYTSELLKDLTDDIESGIKHEDAFEMRKSQRKDINLVILDKALVKSEETIKEIAHRILRDKLGEKDVKAEAIKLAKSALNEVAGSSRLSRLWKELRNLNAPCYYNIVEATKIFEITDKSNKIQTSRRKLAEDFEKIDYPDHLH